MKGPGFFSRFAGRLSREAPHSFWMRLLVLLGILLFVFGLYQGWETRRPQLGGASGTGQTGHHHAR